MKILKFFVIIQILFYFSPSKADQNIFQNKITKNLRCLICQGQSVYDSDSEFATSLKIVVKNKIDEGLSEDQIYNFLAEKYGEWILYDPQLNKNTYLLWFLPILLFIFGGTMILKKLIKKKKHNFLFIQKHILYMPYTPPTLFITSHFYIYTLSMIYLAFSAPLPFKSFICLIAS